MQAAMKELRSLRQEEQTMVALASRISDQLNRLKVSVKEGRNFAPIRIRLIVIFAPLIFDLASMGKAF